jgi:hypothetical protein
VPCRWRPEGSWDPTRAVCEDRLDECLRMNEGSGLGSQCEMPVGRISKDLPRNLLFASTSA